MDYLVAIAPTGLIFTPIWLMLRWFICYDRLYIHDDWFETATYLLKNIFFSFLMALFYCMTRQNNESAWQSSIYLAVCYTIFVSLMYEDEPIIGSILIISEYRQRKRKILID